MQFPAARQFSNRVEEIQMITQKVEELVQGGYVKKCLLNLYGVPGIGKTSLFAMLESIYYNVNQVVMVAFSLAGLEKKYKTNDLLISKLRFLELFVQQLPHAIQQPAQQELGRYPATDITETQLTGMLKLCSESLRRLDKPLLLLIDAWENVHENIFSWFERMLLLPLVQQNHCICVFGSQNELRWRQFEVRRRVQPYQLQALNLHATQMQTQTEQDIEFGQSIFQISFGHPYASEVVFIQLQTGEPTKQWLNDHRCSVVEAVVEELHKRVHTFITEEVRNILEVIALFREFDVSTLRHVVAKFVPALEHRSQSAWLISIKQLVDTQFVIWNHEIRAYQIHPAVRKIFARAIELKDHDRFLAIHAAAAQYYERLIRDVPMNRHTYLAEFYHHSLYKPYDDRYQVEQIIESFQIFLDRYYTNRDGTLVYASLLKSLYAYLLDEELQSTFAAHNLPPTLLADIVEQRL